MPWVYILQCADGSYYTGMSRGQELDQRISDHPTKLSPGAYTASRLPVTLRGTASGGAPQGEEREFSCFKSIEILFQAR